MQLLDNRVCLVTGGASPRSIGYAVAKLFARHGAKVVIADLRVDTSGPLPGPIEAGAGRIEGVRCDVTRPEACEAVVEDIVTRFGRLDSIVNCAGVVEASSLIDIRTADFERMLSINLLGTFNVCKAALKVFLERRSGTIVNLASVAAQRGGGLVGGAHYAAAKGGVISLTRSIAREFGPMGIRANNVCPSLTETGMLDGTIGPEQIAAIVATVPLQRAGRPDDIAGACLFLASDLSAYVTGTTLDVNGGSHIH